MKLTKVSVSKYRSIDLAADFSVGDFTVLIGPNNQGKSNLLRAAVLAMNVFEGWSSLPHNLASKQEIPLRYLLRNTRRNSSRLRSPHDPDYDWERDYPLFARDRHGAQKSTMIGLEFELDETEQSEFQEATGISTNKRLPIKVRLNEDTASLQVTKQGRGSHGKKAREIAAFIVERITVLHIPAVRTSNIAKNIADEILSSRRREMLRSAEYAELIAKIEALDRAVVKEVEELLGDTLGRFIPDTESVTLQVRSYGRGAGLEDILINDGVNTSIVTKGDGFQSLVALALTLEWTRSRSHPDRKLIVAVEEPESHLHPGAVHELRSVLQGIAASQQVIVTTHSQTLVNRTAIEQNVIVGDRVAQPAKSLDDLRTALGVRLSDALAATEVTVICEGWLDHQVLPPLLVQQDMSVAKWLADGRVIFESAGSGSKIYARALAARSILTQPVVVIDGDEAGRKDVNRLEEDSIIDATCVIQIKRKDLKFAELEDIFLFDVYIEAVENAIGFTLSPKLRGALNKGRGGAWSDRLEAVLSEAGVPNEAAMVKRGKRAVCDSVIAAIERGETVIRPDSETLLERLVDVIRRQLHYS